MCSFDVTSLFTNIPLDETLDIVTDMLFSSEHCTHGLDRETFKTLLSLATKDVTFLCNDRYFVQIDGVAMGSPLAPILADLFMIHFEETYLSHWLDSSILASYRYVDDTFIVFEDPADVHRFLTASS